MEYRSCLIVLIGEDTANRPWVLKEIRKAWEKGIGVLGIYIHNVNDPVTGKCNKGVNPFDKFTYGKYKIPFSKIVKCYNPNPKDAYNDIANNIKEWVKDAIKIRKEH